MPRLSPDALPKHGKHKQSGQARVVLNGRHHLLGPYGSKASPQEYDRLVAEWIANGRHVPEADLGDLTVSTLIVRFWKHAETYYRKSDGTPSHELEDFRYALAPRRKLYGGTPAREFGPLALQAVRQAEGNEEWWHSHGSYVMGLDVFRPEPAA